MSEKSRRDPRKDVVIGDPEPITEESNVPASVSRPTSVAQPHLRYKPVRLPSRGLLYTGVPGGEVQIRKMLVAEETALLSAGGDVLTRISRVIQACVSIPGGMRHEDLLLVDRFYLLIALRTDSLGPSYNFSFRCEHCGQINKTTIDIVKELNEKVAVPDGANGHLEVPTAEGEAENAVVLYEPIETKLVDLDATVGLRFLRGSDEAEITRQASRVRARGDGADPTLPMRLARHIVTVDGIELSLLERESLARRLTMRDSATIRLAIEAHEPGIDTTVVRDCTSCGGTNAQSMPFTAEFFRPTHL